MYQDADIEKDINENREIVIENVSNTGMPSLKQLSSAWRILQKKTFFVGTSFNDLSFVNDKNRNKSHYSKADFTGIEVSIARAIRRNIARFEKIKYTLFLSGLFQEQGELRNMADSWLFDERRIPRYIHDFMKETENKIEE